MKNLNNKNPTIVERGKIFFIGDLHLDHANIMKYCKRPFSSVGEMNTFIVDNWNKAIKEKDLVYFLGDMAFGSGSRKTDYWLDKFKGKIVFIKGNHDKSENIEFFDSIELEYKDYRFLLIHNPEKVPEGWGGWVIHGHCHNNDLKNYPFINGKRKTINVGIEVINYKPLDMDELVKLDFENIERMETIDTKPFWKK